MRKSLIFISAVIFIVSCAKTEEYTKVKPKKEVSIVELDRRVKPAPGPTPSLKIPPLRRDSLKNGLGLVLVEHHELPLVEIILVVPTGSSNDPLQLPGLTNFTSDMLNEGTEKRTALEIADDLDFMGANLSTESSWDGSYVRLTTLKEHLEKSLEIFADVVLHPSFPVSELERIRKIRLARILQEKDEPGTVASNTLKKVLYGGQHPYGNPLRGTENSIKSLKREDLVNFYNSYYRPGNSYVIIVGDITLSKSRKLIQKYLGEWQGTPEPEAMYGKHPSPETTKIYLVDKPGAPQSQLRIGHIGLPRNHPDFFPVYVMNTILGGQFTSRINLNLRASKGYTYSARSRFSFRKYAGPFTVRVGVKTAVTNSSIIEIMKEIKGIRDEKVSPEELAFAKKYLIQRLPAKFETPGQIAGQLIYITIYGLPDDYFDNYVKNIQSVTIEDIQRVAKEYLSPENMVIVVVGDAKEIKDDLEALNMGEVVLLRETEKGTVYQ